MINAYFLGAKVELYKVTGYAFTTHPMPPFLKKLADKYIEENFNKTIFSYKNHLFDIRTLNNLANLDCMNCHLAHNKLCCEGPPYPLLNDDIIKVEDNLQDIFLNTLGPEKSAYKMKLIQEHGLTDQENNIIVDCGNCIFFNEIEGESKGCSIHLYALKQQIEYIDIKPSSCLMYPLDVLTLDNGGYFVFSIDEKTVVNIESTEVNGKLEYSVFLNNIGFSQWNQHDLEPLCVNIENRRNVNKRKSNPLYKQNISENIYMLKDYLPVYKVESRIISKFFGNDSYSFIEKCRKSCLTLRKTVIQL